MQAPIWHHQQITLPPHSAGCFLITKQILQVIEKPLSTIEVGLCHIFIQHTSAGLAICENADPSVRKDISSIFNRLVPEGDHYEHDDQGPDDMPAHAKSILSGVDLTIPIYRGKLTLGTWQGVYLMEYRKLKQSRSIIVTLNGTSK